MYKEAGLNRQPGKSTKVIQPSPLASRLDVTSARSRSHIFAGSNKRIDNSTSCRLSCTGETAGREKRRESMRERERGERDRQREKQTERDRDREIDR